MTPSALLAVSVLTLATIPQPPPAPPFAAEPSGPSAPSAPRIELVDAGGKVLGTLISFASSGGMGASGFYGLVEGRIFAFTHGRGMMWDDPIRTAYSNAVYQLSFGTPDCTGTAYAYPPMYGPGALEGFVATVAQFPDGAVHVVELTPGWESFELRSYVDSWSGACTALAEPWPSQMPRVVDVAVAPSFTSPLRPRVAP